MPKVRFYIPSMFHRRLLLLGTLCVLALLLLSSRLGYMTIVDGAQARIDAERRLVTETWLPTTRGSIYDRKGRVLAGDRASYDIALHYRVLEGKWVYQDGAGRWRWTEMRTYATRLAQRANPDIWDTLPEDEQTSVIDRFESSLRARVQRMERDLIAMSGMEPSEFQKRKQDILDRVGAMKREIADRAYQRELAQFERTGRVPSEDDLDRFRRIANQPIAEEETTHTIIPDVHDELGFAVLRQIARSEPIISDGIQASVRQALSVPVYPGLSVSDTTARLTPYDTLPISIDRRSFPPPLQSPDPVTINTQGVARILLGRVDDGLYAEDVRRRKDALLYDDQMRARSLTESGRDRGRYMPGDRVGRTGIEHAFEHTLRGLRGVRTENMQTGEVLEVAPEPGQDVHLSIDIMLQARIRALLDPSLGLARVQPWHNNEQPLYTPTGTDLDAGVIVLEVATGEILAMVSTPLPPDEGDWASLGVTNDMEQRLYNLIHAPWVNKAIAKPYPPGSVAKAFILTEAAKRGLYTPGERIEATGHLLPNQPNKFRSWIYKQHNITHYQQLGRHPDGVDALMVSSNVFFFTLGRRLGPERIAEAYRDFHVASPYNLGVGSEWPGSIGPFGGPNDGSDINLDEATLMSIGQGPITWTPLHAADAMATLARAGIAITPSIVRDGRAPEIRDIAIPSWVVNESLEGLHQVVSNEQFGTGRAIRYESLGTEAVPIFNAPGIRVWGKTGTATAPALVFDPDETEEANGPAEPRVVRMGDHSWYVTLVAPEGESPKYAIAVIVEYAGSGGRVSGPINNQIIHALIDEGYLPNNEPQEPDA
ncbi:MAG: penicillin-binding transpeptidase domain-containing protein [Phycisphaerales bacterium JB052]